MNPTVGDTVLYALDDWDVKRLSETYRANVGQDKNFSNWFDGAKVGKAELGQLVPMYVVRSPGKGESTTIPYEGTVNGQVFVDGEVMLWKTCVREGTEPGTWRPRECAS